jgi:hypothetical protein
MSFDYKPYATNLLALLKDPRTWLGIESQRLDMLNRSIVSTNGIYSGLNDAQKKSVDAEAPGCAGLMAEIKNSNDADKLLFAVFGPMHPMNPTEKTDRLIQCVINKIQAILKINPSSSITVPTFASHKEKYLKYKNKYLQLRNNF